MGCDITRLKEMTKKLFALKGRAPDSFVIGAWCEVLVKFEEPDIVRAFGACLQADGFFEIKMVLDQLIPSPREKAARLWDDCMGVMGVVGGAAELSQEAKDLVAAVGGWTDLRNKDKDMMWKRFLSAYKEKFPARAYDDLLRIEQ